MANHKNAEKCIRKIARRTAINKNRRTAVRTIVKTAETALGLHHATPMPQADAVALIRNAESALMRGAQKGIINKKTAARKVSRLTKRLKALA